MDRIRLRAGIAAIGAICGAIIGFKFKISLIDIVFSNGTAITVLIIGTFAGWYASKIVPICLVAMLAPFFQNNWAACTRFVVNFITVLLSFSILLIPSSLLKIMLRVLGVPVIIVALLTGIDNLKK